MSDQLTETEAELESSGTSETGEESKEVSDGADDTGTSDDKEASTDDGEGTSDTKDEWLVYGKFRRGEEHKLAESYRNLESEFTRRNNEYARLRQAQTQVKPDREVELAEFATTLKKDPVEAVRKTVSPLVEEAKQEIKQLRFEQEYHRRMQDPKFAALEPIMTQLAIDNRDFLQSAGVMHDPKVLDWLHYTALGIQAEESTKKAEARGKKKGAADAMKKAKVQVEGASGTKGATQKKFNELSREEMRAEILKGNI